MHKSTVIDDIDMILERPVLIDGGGKCPPEDCGGVDGYKDFLIVMANPAHEEYEELKAWAGLPKNSFWDPHEFNLEKQASRLAGFARLKVRKK